MILNEQQLTEKLVWEFFNTNKVWYEVPNMGQSVDVVVDSEGFLTFIEVKIKNWTKAIEQCIAHEIVADYIYIAIATKSIPENFVNEAKTKGYGILHYNWDYQCWEHSLKSKKNSNIWMPQRQILNSKLKLMSYAC